MEIRFHLKVGSQGITKGLFSRASKKASATSLLNFSSIFSAISKNISLET